MLVIFGGYKFNEIGEHHIGWLSSIVSHLFSIGMRYISLSFSMYIILCRW